MPSEDVTTWNVLRDISQGWLNVFKGVGRGMGVSGNVMHFLL